MLHGMEFNNWLVWTVTGLSAGLLALLIGFVVWRKLASMEHRTRHLLANIADRVIRDAAIPDGMGGWVVIDAIMLRDRCIHVLDFRDVEGAIFGAEKMDQWTIIGHRRRSQFQNPLRFMQDRVIAVRALLPELAVSGHVLFSARGQFLKGRPEGVQLLEEFAQPLLRAKQKQPVELDTQTQMFWQRLCDAAEIVSGRSRQTGVRAASAEH
ncbi:MAG TPA: NERD domain-containing protein [Gammaproteobacteria bacterium]|nr:NERD domain-containing protein [Gammaproteobacteria bacterium]